MWVLKELSLVTSQQSKEKPHVNRRTLEAVRFSPYLRDKRAPDEMNSDEYRMPVLINHHDYTTILVRLGNGNSCVWCEVEMYDENRTIVGFTAAVVQDVAITKPRPSESPKKKK
jgi:hypothetical protein